MTSLAYTRLIPLMYTNNTSISPYLPQRIHLLLYWPLVAFPNFCNVLAFVPQHTFSSGQPVEDKYNINLHIKDYLRMVNEPILFGPHYITVAQIYQTRQTQAKLVIHLANLIINITGSERLMPHLTSVQLLDWLTHHLR